jgi:hypothetical protein
VQRLLGRPYRLVAGVPNPAAALQSHNGTGGSLLPASTFLNQPPAPGRYNCGCAVVPLVQAPSSSSRGGGPSAAGSRWEPLILPSLLPGADGISPAAHSSNGSSNLGSIAGESRGAGVSISSSQAGLREVQLIAQGLVLEPLPGGLLEQLKQLGDYPCYVVLDFDMLA